MRATEAVRRRRSRRWAALLVLAVVLVTVAVVLAVVMTVMKGKPCKQTAAAISVGTAPDNDGTHCRPTQYGIIRYSSLRSDTIRSISAPIQFEPIRSVGPYMSCGAMRRFTVYFSAVW